MVDVSKEENETTKLPMAAKTSSDTIGIIIIKLH